MSHLLHAQVNPLNLNSHHMRTLKLMSLNLRWLQHNPWRNLLVSPHFTFFTITNFPSPLLLLPTPYLSSTICPLAPPSTSLFPDSKPLTSNPTPVPSPEISTNSSLHSHDEAWKEFTNFQPTLMIP
ncbi:hypothetical protein O181_002742 [Austropuccinia psidii MF-1]|uniref:Uncharacterized protein n=1 Tax=Austropuccinia psidii MF-1 TaxID=1389203 RepID=A0A9Q3BD23_9BASI|nr:hypothetical protein [Austropuccinia psidii MF-1]